MALVRVSHYGWDVYKGLAQGRPLAIKPCGHGIGLNRAELVATTLMF